MYAYIGIPMFKQYKLESTVNSLNEHTLGRLILCITNKTPSKVHSSLRQTPRAYVHLGVNGVPCSHYFTLRTIWCQSAMRVELPFKQRLTCQALSITSSVEYCLIPISLAAIINPTEKGPERTDGGLPSSMTKPFFHSPVFVSRKSIT